MTNAEVRALDGCTGKELLSGTDKFGKPSTIVQSLNDKIVENKQSLIGIVYSWFKYSTGLNNNDGIILGASNKKQLEINLNIWNNCQPLSQIQVQTIKNTWETIAEYSPEYYY